jgi:transposase InsO family protein
MKILGIQQMHSSAYNPRGNGTIETLQNHESKTNSLCKFIRHGLGYLNSILRDGVTRNPIWNTWVQPLLPVTWQRNGSSDYTRPQSKIDGRS